MLVILLLIATAVSASLWLLERDAALPYEAIAIFAIVLLNAVMGYVQQARAEHAVAALREMSAAKANVVRVGARQSIPAAEVVPGDIIVVEEGDTVPADARLIRCAALQTAEAPLTGESLPVAKDVAAINAEALLGDRHNMIFSGTAATYGRGKAVVTATGMRPQMGAIAGLLEEAPQQTTPLQKELAHVGKLLGGIVVVIAIVMIGTIIVVEEVRGVSAHLRCPDSRCRARGGRGAGGPAGRRNGGARAGCPADGETQRDRPPPCRRGDARLGECHRVRQDRYADEE